MLIDLLAVILVGIGFVRGAIDGIGRTTLDLVFLLVSIPVAFRLGGAVGDLVFSGFAPVFGRTLGAVVVLALVGLAFDRFVIRRLAKSADLTDWVVGAGLGGLRGWVFATMAAIILSGLASGFGAAGTIAGSALADAVTDDGSWSLAVFRAATGDEQLIRTVEFHRQYPDGPVLSEEYQALPATPLSDLERDPEAGFAIAQLVNEARLESELSSLRWSEALADVAAAYATELATEGFFAHDSPRTGNVGDRLHAAGLTYRSAGENLALGPTVERVHDGLMNSPTHRANILGSQYSSVGVGVVTGPLGLMVVEVFQG